MCAAFFYFGLGVGERRKDCCVLALGLHQIIQETDGYGIIWIIAISKPGFTGRRLKMIVRSGLEYRNIPDEYVMACELVVGALGGISGTTKCC